MTEMNTLLLPRSQDLIKEITSRLINSEKDFSDYLVVFPGKRPSHFLRKALAERETESLIPPVIFSIDEFIDSIFERELGFSGRKLEAIDSVAILYDIHKKDTEPLGGDQFISPDNFFSIGLKIYKDIEELYIEKVDPQKIRTIENITELSVPGQTAGRLQSLLYFYEEFYKAIEKLNYTTRSLRYRVVSEKIDDVDLSRFEKIIISGFFALTNSEKSLFKKLVKRDNALFIFQEGPGIEEKLEQSGLSYSQHKGTDNIKKTQKTDVRFYQSPDTHGQVFGLSSILKNDIEKKIKLDEKTVVVLPSSETLFPLLNQTLTLVDQGGYNISMGYPLHRTPVFGFFNNIMNLVASMDGDRFYLPDYLKFILHPYTKNIYFRGRSDVTRVMFHSLEKNFTDKISKSFIRLSEIEENIEFFKKLSKDASFLKERAEDIRETDPVITAEDLREHLKSIHRNIICKFQSFKNINDFALKSIDVLAFIHKNSTARFHPFFHPFSEGLVKSLDTIACSLFKDIHFQETSGFFNFFRKHIATCRAPFEGTPLKGLQVLGLLETRNLKFDRVFVLDVNEGVLPDAIKEDSFLPHKVREFLGVPTYRDREKLTAYYFETLLKGSGEAHIFFVEKANKEKSRFVEKLIWEKQKKDKNLNSKDYIQSVRYHVKLHGEKPAPIEKTEEVVSFLRLFSYSASSVDTYMRCPLMFYYKYVLNLGEKKSTTENIEKVQIGNLVHKVLSIYFKGRTGHRLEVKDINLKEMDELVGRLLIDEFGEELSGAAYLLNVQIKRRMREFLENHQIPLIKKEKVEIQNLEFNLKAFVNSFNLKGKLDRVEMRNGKTFIIDYKTSTNEKNMKINFDKFDPNDKGSWHESLGSLQLPFYMILFVNKTGENIENVNGAFLSLSRLTIDEKAEIPLFKSTDEASCYFPLLQEVIFKIIGEIAGPETPFQAVLSKKKTCLTCSYQYICGT